MENSEERIDGLKPVTDAEMADAGSVRLSYEDILAHAVEMEAQGWWPLHVSEQALPPCPTCGGRQELLLSGAGWCDACDTQTDSQPGLADG